MDDKEYKCDLIPLIVYVPSNTVALDLNATVIEKDKSTQNVMNTMSMPELYEARLDGEEWESKNVKYKITDEAREFLDNGGTVEELLNK